MKTRLHVGCGPVYLVPFDKTEEWINIDVPISNHHLAKDRPDLVKINSTTVDNYYKYSVTQKQIEKRTFNKQEVVVDQYGYADKLPFADIDEIHTNQVFEHFTYKEGEDLLRYWHDLLSKGGKVHIDIPDLDGTISLYNEAKTKEERDWAIRLLFGSQKNEFGLHKAMYNKEMIRELLLKCGYRRVKFGGNIHFYPAFWVEAYR